VLAQLSAARSVALGTRFAEWLGMTHNPSETRSMNTVRAVQRFLREREGASFIEYIIVVGLVAIIAITAFTDFGDKVVAKLRDETQALDKIQVK